jgi:hypothetical protein
MFWVCTLVFPDVLSTCKIQWKENLSSIPLTADECCVYWPELLDFIEIESLVFPSWSKLVSMSGRQQCARVCTVVTLFKGHALEKKFKIRLVKFCQKWHFDVPNAFFKDFSLIFCCLLSKEACLSKKMTTLYVCMCMCVYVCIHVYVCMYVAQSSIEKNMMLCNAVHIKMIVKEVATVMSPWWFHCHVTATSGCSKPQLLV